MKCKILIANFLKNSFCYNFCLYTISNKDFSFCYFVTNPLLLYTTLNFQIDNKRIFANCSVTKLRFSDQRPFYNHRASSY